jgi:hypothetical protein
VLIRRLQLAGKLCTSGVISDILKLWCGLYSAR